MEPRVIKTDSEYRAYLAEVERLVRLDPTADSSEGQRLELLALLVEQFEQRKFPFEKPDPIEAILFRMNEQGLRQADLVPYIGSRSRVSEVLARKRPLTVQMIREVADGLGIPADVLVGVPTPPESSDAVAESSLEWDKFPVKEMDRHGYFNTVREAGTRSLGNLARDFYTMIFGSAEGSPLLARRGLRGDAVTVKSRYGVIAWKARVIDLARKIRRERNIPAYRFEALDSTFLAQVAKLSWHPNGIRLACELIEGIGVPVVIEPRLAGTHLDGAAILDVDGSPVIGLTLRIDRIDYFWFTLLHELAHVMKHLSSPGDAFLDRLEDREATEVLEVEANKIARDTLIPRATWRRSEVAVAPTRQRILSLARELSVHPAIVAGRVRRETGNYRVFTDLVGWHEVRRHFPSITFE
jgi:HTH-type transcriptional regulator / antitoxin HigA